MPTNEERAERGKAILEIYVLQFGEPFDPAANLTDMLTDLMHTAVRKPELGLRFQASLEMASWHFDAETKEYIEK